MSGNAQTTNGGAQAAGAQPAAEGQPTQQLASVRIDPGMPLAPGGVVAQAPAVEPDDAAVGVQVDGEGRKSVPDSAFAKIKDNARAKGKQEAQDELERQVREAGFQSFADLLSRVKRLGADPSAPRKEPRPMTKPSTTPPKPTPTKPPQAAEPPSTAGLSARARARLEREREQLQRDVEDMKSKASREEAKRKKVERDLEAARTEMALREMAIRAGVRDIDYAVELVRREIRAKDEAALKEFKPADYFAGLRKDRPYLFGEVEVPANTAPAPTNGAPPPPKPGDATAQAAKADQIDARKMNQADFNELLRKRGLSANSTAVR
jgi:hypothetical protein